MKFPFVTRSHHEEVVAELRRQLSDMDAERKKVFDAYCAAIGQPNLFSPSQIIVTRADEEPEVDEQDMDVKPVPRRPSQVVAHVSAQTQRKFDEKYRPSAAAAADLDAAKRRGIDNAKTQ